jgi:hypothetical protein
MPWEDKYRNRMPSCCSSTLVEGEKPHPASYRGCSHAKGGPQRRREQWALKRSGRIFVCKFTSPEKSYAAALRQTQHQQPQTDTWEKCNAPHSAASATTGKSENRSVRTGSWFILEWHFKSHHCSVTDHGRAHWNSVRRRKNNYHYKNDT